MAKEAAEARRASHRITVAGNDKLVVRIWRIARHEVIPIDPPDSVLVPAVALDISFGGVGLLLEAPEAKALQLAPGDMLGLLVETHGERLVLHSKVCWVHGRDDRRVRAGVSFEVQPMTPERKRAVRQAEKFVATIDRMQRLRRATFGLTE